MSVSFCQAFNSEKPRGGYFAVLIGVTLAVVGTLSILANAKQVRSKVPLLKAYELKLDLQRRSKATSVQMEQLIASRVFVPEPVCGSDGKAINRIASSGIGWKHKPSDYRVAFYDCFRNGSKCRPGTGIATNVDFLGTSLGKDYLYAKITSESNGKTQTRQARFPFENGALVDLPFDDGGATHSRSIQDKSSQPLNGIFYNEVPSSNINRVQSVSFGNALSIPGESKKSFVVIPDDPSFDLPEGTVAIRFRARSLPPPNSSHILNYYDTGTLIQGLFCKDQSGDLDGHLCLFINYWNRPHDNLIYARIQSETAPYTEVLLASPGPVAVGKWNLVVVSFGPLGFKMYVNPPLNNFRPERQRPDVTFGLDVGTGNRQPWIVGAQNASTPAFESFPNPRDYYWKVDSPFEGDIERFTIWDWQFSNDEVRLQYIIHRELALGGC